MAERLDLSDEDLEDVFGVEVEPRKTSKGEPEDRGIKVRVVTEAEKKSEKEKPEKGWLRGLGRSVARGWAGLSPAVKWGTGGLLVGGALAVIAGRVGKASAAETAAPPPAPPPPPPGDKTAHAGAALRVVSKVPANLRASAGTKAAVVGLLAPGAGVTVADSATGPDGARWYKVQTHDGREGWVHGDLLR